MKLTKNQWYIVGVVALIAIWYFFIRKKPKTTAILEENKFASGRGSQIVEPIVSFVIAMSKDSEPLSPLSHILATNDFRNSFKGDRQVRSYIENFVKEKFTITPVGFDMVSETKFMKNMEKIGYIIFVEPIISFVNDIKKGKNDKMAIKNFRNKMQRI